MSEYSDFKSTSNLGKNAIINGAMRVSQRGTLFTSASNGQYTLDRYQYNKIGSMDHTIRQYADHPNGVAGNCLRAFCNTGASLGASDNCYMLQYIEGVNFQPLIGEECTFSFWVKANKTGTLSVLFSNSGFDRRYISEITIDSADTWEKKEVNVTFDYTGGTWDYGNGIGLRVALVLAAGSGVVTTDTDQWVSTGGGARR